MASGSGSTRMQLSSLNTWVCEPMRVANARALYDERYSPEAYRDKMRRLFDLATR